MQTRAVYKTDDQCSIVKQTSAKCHSNSLHLIHNF